MFPVSYGDWAQPWFVLCDIVEGETGNCNRTGVMCDDDGTEEVSMKVEDAIDVKEEFSIEVVDTVDIKDEIQKL